ncbi:hypothetical protein ACHAW5_010045 [Stephanodiscus triporus]|uniref:Nucleolar complex-associated protein 3 N-terminal domain-containing protein n=1 Tax=Stephanodiscus triporus TaxID=2934178 RepID=A0ABD3QUP4_9STRA
MAAEKTGRKRSRTSASASSSLSKHDDNSTSKQPTRRQKRAASAAGKATPRLAPPRPSGWDVPLETLTPQRRIDLIADLSESILEDPTSALISSRVDAIGGGGGGGEDEDGAKKALYRKTPSRMNKLLDLATLSDNGHDAHAARLALLSLLAIFQDILPAYRLRLPTESELSVRVSKETKATWDHERRLLQSYQRYLQLLERTWEEGRFGRRWSSEDGRGKGGRNDNNRARAGGGECHGPPTTLAATAILALSALLRTNYNFNFRTNLLRIVVRQANRRSSGEVRLACCDALSAMFASDAGGDASLEAVRMMSKMVKQQQRESGGIATMHPDALNTWLSLPLRVHEDEAAAARLASAAKARKAKKSQSAKESLDIEREMKEGEATVDRLELAKNQADTLHAITLAYFRILKSVSSGVRREEEDDGNATAAGKGKAGDRATSPSELLLLPCALRGLAKFSHLIHLDAVVDLLAVLRDLLKNASSLPTDVAINCILCALKTLRGPGREALPVDPKEYLIPLYNILPRLGTATIVVGHGGDKDDHAIVTLSGNGGRDGTIEAAIQCLDHAFLHRRELSTSRLAAFVKRLVTASLHCPPQSSVPLLACARQISSRYSNSSSSKLARMLENEEDVVAEGVFAPDAEDPEHSNAHATSLWELALMKYAIHPSVAEQASMMAQGRPLKLPAESPCRIWVCRDAQEGFISSTGVTWKRHPLDNANSQPSDDAEGVVEGSRWKRRQQRRSRDKIRFITPRRTGGWHLLPATSYSML